MDKSESEVLVPEKPSLRQRNTAAGTEKVKTNAKRPLLSYINLPAYLQDNEFILSHYRADWPISATLSSIFRLHNESGNIWTHLIGFFVFAGLTIYSIIIPAETLLAIDPLQESSGSAPEDAAAAAFSNANAVGHAVARWPLFTFLIGAMICLLCSATCHLLCCHSCRTNSIVWRFDYAGIAVMIATSCVPSIYYSFMCHPGWSAFYICAIFVLGAAATAVAVLEYFQKPSYRPLRAAVFVSLGLSASVPCLHKLALMSHVPAVFNTTIQEVAMGGMYILGAIVYTLRVPERWHPGKFDLAGHSHQIFHILVVLAAYTHYRTSCLYLSWRASHHCQMGEP